MTSDGRCQWSRSASTVFKRERVFETLVSQYRARNRTSNGAQNKKRKSDTVARLAANHDAMELNQVSRIVVDLSLLLRNWELLVECDVQHQYIHAGLAEKAQDPLGR